MVIKKINKIEASHVFKVVPLLILAMIIVMVVDFYVFSNKIKKATIYNLPGHESISETFSGRNRR
ncbi:MAG: hypothetical protein US81_C0002G0025 [Parcubacteria group bacterium GW2011_GWE2_38_18]|nr:MAG: hypothetical protein US81_C0002G0025 [Parcubacteria group bacterium GW2011_GWE2_38_18]